MDEQPRTPCVTPSISDVVLTIIVAGAMIVSAEGCSGAAREGIAQGTDSARAELVNAAGERIGEATLREGPHGVHVQIRLDGATAGAHAMHVHEVGRCEPSFDAAGGHWNPHGREHGFMNPNGPHAGDLPNLHIPENGRLDAELFLDDVRLHGASGMLGDDGTALVMHEGPDDHRTDPSGDSGDRVACGVIHG